MPSNRRRHGNVLPLASFATWILIAAFVSGGGLYYVYCKNDLHKSGGEIRRLEQELTELRNQNEVVRSRIDKLSSPKELQKRREKDKNFLAGYVEITREHLIVVNDKATAGSDLRPVSNPAPEHMLRSAPERVLAACCVLVCCFTGFSYRLVQLQVSRHDEYAALAAKTHGTSFTISARRGTIYDIRGTPLAQNEPVKTVFADPSVIRDFDGVAQTLAEVLHMEKAELLATLQRTDWSDREQKVTYRKYVRIKKEVSELVATQLAEALAAKKLRGVGYEQDSIRVYPNGEMACHVVGYTNNDGNGMEGIERSMNDVLRARNGYRYSERDRHGQEMVQFRGQERPAQDGSDVRLTIDSGLQMILETELDAAAKLYKPSMATAIMMRPQTGEILAMANWPHYDLTHWDKVVDPAYRVNHAIMDQIEPGSTFKIVPASAAITLRLVNMDTMIFCENGRFTYHGNTLHDHKPLGEIPVSDVLIKSSNIGAAKLGIQLGDQRLFEYARRFGFGERTGINLPGEIGGRVIPPSQWSPISITHLPMGHEVDVTPLQIVTAMSVIANGGLLMMPQIVHEVVDKETGKVTSYPPVEVRRVIPQKVADEMRLTLGQVVGKKGTAQKAHVPGFLVGGKTGTAQKANRNKGYMPGKYVVSFVGFLPVENPEFVCLVVVDDPKVDHEHNYGGMVAAPVFAKIAEKAARHMNLTPTEPILPGDVAGAGDAVRD